ncbi:MAG: alpha/beta hydrolase [Methanospirillum sp.]|uniref:alpha/beta hydrolase n=1 Tax=Methanospirillum sp. TaxID=45200 RepID=UPI00236B9666|nr:alpha/beta hydrolase [Methanospirillum sp.]MDD1727694.1 alpha/beta hydrolase [Methanospirillum sp.]
MRTESSQLVNPVSPHWILEKPEHPLPGSLLAILCGDWSYGIIPHCGPGIPEALWLNEGIFLHELSTALTSEGIYTLRLSSHEDGIPRPDDALLSQSAGPEGVLTALKNLDPENSWDPSAMIFIGHGLGGYVHCQLASYGIRPGAFIFAGGIYSDLEVILSLKYLLPIEARNIKEEREEAIIPDPCSQLIAENIGSILHAIRRNRTRIHLQNNSQSLDIPLDRMLFTGNETPKAMFRFVTSPTLIIHGASDLDVSVWNATSIEQSIRQVVHSPERIILEDRDHWFRIVPGTVGMHMQDRITGKSFSYEPDNRIFNEYIGFIKRVYGLEETEKDSVKKSSALNHNHRTTTTSKETS